MHVRFLPAFFIYKSRFDYRRIHHVPNGGRRLVRVTLLSGVGRRHDILLHAGHDRLFLYRLYTPHSKECNNFNVMASNCVRNSSTDGLDQDLRFWVFGTFFGYPCWDYDELGCEFIVHMLLIFSLYSFLQSVYHSRAHCFEGEEGAKWWTQKKEGCRWR